MKLAANKQVFRDMTVSIHISDYSEMKSVSSASAPPLSKVSIHISDYSEMKSDVAINDIVVIEVSIHISDYSEMKLRRFSLLRLIDSFNPHL